MGSRDLDEMQIGESLGWVAYEVTKEDLQQFRLGVGDYKYQGIVHDYDYCLPPFIIANDYLKLYKKKYSTVGALHAQLDMEVLGSLRNGERIVTSGKIVDKFVNRGKTSVIILTETVNSESIAIVKFTVKLTYIL